MRTGSGTEVGRIDMCFNEMVDGVSWPEGDYSLGTATSKKKCSPHGQCTSVMVERARGLGTRGGEGIHSVRQASTAIGCCSSGIMMMRVRQTFQYTSGRVRST